MGIKEKFKSIREKAENITEGKLQTQHLGEQNYQTINQEIFSLRNTKPAFRADQWNKRFQTVKDSIMKKISRNSNSIMCQVWLKEMEAIHNER